MLTANTLLIIGMVVLLTHLLEAITGFGCTALAFPFVLMLTSGDMEHTKILLTLLAWALALYFVITKFHSINWKQFAIIATLTGAGLPVGMLLFKNADTLVLTRILGAFICVSAALQLFHAIADRIEAIIPRYIYLLFGGIAHGAFATGGPLIVLYSAFRIPDKGQFRATMCLLWTVLNSVLILQFILADRITATTGYESLFLLPFLIAGIVGGELIHRKVSETLFKKIVFVSLIFIGALMLF